MNKQPIITIVGNRPQFIKLAPVHNEIKSRGLEHIIIHTGQHYDDNMNKVFFADLNLPKPDIQLTIASKTHGKMTAEILTNIEEHLISLHPKGIIIFGDTNSTLAAALAAVKLHIPIAHIEAGPRTYNKTNPEEANRIVADHLADLLFCPDTISQQNLAKENLTAKAHFTGDVMYDAYLHFNKFVNESHNIIHEFGLTKNNYHLLTLHRPENTDNKTKLENLISLLQSIDKDIVFPIHPRTENCLREFGLLETLKQLPNLKVIPPQGYLNMLALINHADVILTDSGGLQKEAYFASKPVITFFYRTPWPQIETCGWQTVVGCLDNIDPKAIQTALTKIPKQDRPDFFGDGHAARKIVDVLCQHGWFQNPSPSI